MPICDNAKKQKPDDERGSTGLLGNLGFLLIHKTLMMTLIGVLLSGCVGVLVDSAQEVDFGNVSLSPKRGRIVEKNKAPEMLTKADIMAQWGEPDNINISGARSTLHYNHEDLSWVGVLPVLIIPIPLVVPSGHDQLLLDFDNDTLARIRARRSGFTSGGVCGILLKGPCAAPVLGCDFVTADQSTFDRIKSSFTDRSGLTPKDH